MSHPYPAAEPTCRLGYLRVRFGVRAFKDGRMVTFVRMLVAERGFPPPLPTMVRGALVDAVVANSAWRRDAVDAWFDDRLPPPVSAAADRAAARHAAAAMDAAAAGLGAPHPRLRLISGGRA